MSAATWVQGNICTLRGFRLHGKSRAFGRVTAAGSGAVELDSALGAQASYFSMASLTFSPAFLTLSSALICYPCRPAAPWPAPAARHASRASRLFAPPTWSEEPGGSPGGQSWLRPGPLSGRRPVRTRAQGRLPRRDETRAGRQSESARCLLRRQAQPSMSAQTRKEMLRRRAATARVTRSAAARVRSNAADDTRLPAHARTTDR
jgi:hypothetical protein